MTADLVHATFDERSCNHVLVRQIEALGRPGDVAFGISTSGAVGRAAAIHLNVPSEVTARVQEVHRTLLHVICDIVERSLVDR